MPAAPPVEQKDETKPVEKVEKNEEVWGVTVESEEKKEEKVE